jgi:hypothetical protein
MGCGTYRPLDNIKYQQEFQYEPFQEVDRNGKGKRAGAIYISTKEELGAQTQSDAQQADIPWLALNLAFIPHDKRATLNFNTKGGNKIFTK